jgi:hypothetical protein
MPAKPWPPERTEFEKSMQRVLFCNRYNHKPGRLPDDKTIGYRYDDAMRGGAIYSLYGHFTAEQMAEWAFRVLEWLTDARFKAPDDDLGFKYDDTWDDVRREVEGRYNRAYDEAQVEIQGELDAYDTKEDFEKAFPHLTVEVSDNIAGTIFGRGKVCGDPWGHRYDDSARWFLANMTQFVVFTFYQVVRAAADECTEANIGWWADGDSSDDPRRDALKAWNDMMQNFGDYLTEVLPATQLPLAV